MNRSAFLSVPAVRRLARALRTSDPARALYDSNRACGLATGLKDLGLREADIPRAVEIVAARTFPNPRRPTTEDIHRLVRQAYAGEPPRF